MNKRYDQLKKKLIENKCFKVICGAGNEDIDEVKKFPSFILLQERRYLMFPQIQQLLKLRLKVLI